MWWRIVVIWWQSLVMVRCSLSLFFLKNIIINFCFLKRYQSARDWCISTVKKKQIYYGFWRKIYNLIGIISEHRSNKRPMCWLMQVSLQKSMLCMASLRYYRLFIFDVFVAKYCSKRIMLGMVAAVGTGLYLFFNFVSFHFISFHYYFLYKTTRCIWIGFGSRDVGNNILELLFICFNQVKFVISQKDAHELPQLPTHAVDS